RLLFGIEHVTGGREPDHHVVLRQVLCRERFGILGVINRETVRLPQILNRCDASFDRTVAEGGGLAEDECTEGRALRRVRTLPCSFGGSRLGTCITHSHRGVYRPGD